MSSEKTLTATPQLSQLVRTYRCAIETWNDRDTALFLAPPLRMINLDK